MQIGDAREGAGRGMGNVVFWAGERLLKGDAAVVKRADEACDTGA